MKRPSGLAYLVLAAVALAPVGLRIVTWAAGRHRPLDATLADAGRTLFNHEWTPHDPLANGGDGLGPVYNATSCVACHSQSGVGGAGPVRHNVTTFTVRLPSSHRPLADADDARQGVVHAHAVNARYQETLADIDRRLPPRERPTLAELDFVPPGHCGPLGLPVPRRGAILMPNGIHVSQRNTPALFGDGLIDQIPASAIIANERAQKLKWPAASFKNETLPRGRALRLADGRIGRFGWKAQSASLGDFVRDACANELGLSNPDHPQPQPLGHPEYKSPALDLTSEQCDQITAFVGSLPRPEERMPADQKMCQRIEFGRRLFATVGCADCHTPKVGPVDGIYSDLLLHNMGEQLAGGGSYGEPPLPEPDGSPGDGPSPGEWRTPPLWGVADSGPYMHDGRALTLQDAIRLHGGQGRSAAQRFAGLGGVDQYALISFLQTLKAPDRGFLQTLKGQGR
jgi:CxxC motif-containing protein (DUF1111 family)